MTRNQNVRRPNQKEEMKKRIPEKRNPLEAERDFWMDLSFLIATVLGLVLILT